MKYTATTGRLSLGLLGLEGEALGLSALLARGHDNQLFVGLGQRRVWAKTARQTFNRLDFRDNAATLWSTALARDVGGSKIPAEHQGTNLAGKHTRLCTASGRISSEETPTEPDIPTSSKPDSCCSCCRAGCLTLLLTALGGVSEQILIIFFASNPTKADH